ncbi:MAG TPA: glycoside hydrolase family 125 protein [Firmicutes bacterium]|jgi:hypothetical protein|nr:MAG: hypothetical protein AA931_09375 [Peptococcaceae bacterium 1109]HHT73646.1 glycoside hydrolase family 125 protein [Bacillota bacterium]
MTKYYVTSNEFISLPTIREDGALEGLTFLHMRAKGMLHVKGAGEEPLLRPMAAVDGQPVDFAELNWDRDQYWIPRFSGPGQGVAFEGCILAPLGERGFIYRLTARACDPVEVCLGFEGCFGEVWHAVNENKPVKGEKHAYASGWNHAFVMDFRTGLPLFSLAPMAEKAEWKYSHGQDDSIRFEITRTVHLAPGEEATLDVYWGVGYEEVAASTAAKEMLRQGWAEEYAKTQRWLAQRIQRVGHEHLQELLNLNMFFSFFFGSGITLDTEEFCLVTSRSPRYYVSAAYWDRDSLLWSFPAILMADPEYAREMLDYTFTRQIKNVGIHSRFIDGTVLEPGFELDELCAPIIALKRYVDRTGDRIILEEAHVRRGVERILRILKTKRHPGTHLYETFLQPTDDMHTYKYLTYDNVLVWRILTDLQELYGLPLLEEAQRVKDAIYQQCVKVYNGKKVFAWSVDLEGAWDIYDEPPGSLLLLPWYGFCSAYDEIYRNTVAVIRDPEYKYSFAGKPIAEIGCAHAPHPWVLSICNSLLSGNTEQALRHLSRTELDNGIACESVHEETGECMTGAAFATCAGFLAFALKEALAK